MNTTDKSTNKKEKNREIYIPTLTIILMLLFGIPGLIALHSYRTTLRNCSSEVTGFIEDEHRGNGGSIMLTVEGKYVDSKATRYFSIIVNTDAHFMTEVGVADGSLRMLEEIGFPEELVVNSSVERFEKYLKEHNLPLRQL